MENLMLQWALCAAVLLGFLMAISILCGRGFLGFLVDSRNKRSLSRFQVTLWTITLLSAATALMFGKHIAMPDMDASLWKLMGISLGSAAGAAMVKANKARQKIDVAKFPGAQSISPLQTADKPSWADMFLGEETTDFKYIDIGKVQMFLITIIVWFIYCMALSAWKGEGGFPALSESMLVLIGISHAGYLTIKATPKTPVE